MKKQAALALSSLSFILLSVFLGIPGSNLGRAALAALVIIIVLGSRDKPFIDKKFYSASLITALLAVSLLIFTFTRYNGFFKQGSLVLRICAVAVLGAGSIYAIMYFVNSICCACVEGSMSAVGGKTKKGTAVLVGAVLASAALAVSLGSPNNPWGNGISKTDSSVFRYIGFGMTKGIVPYRDSFDHKGPLVYFLNYLGALISYEHGIWLVELVLLIASAYIAYKTARLFAGAVGSVFAVLAAFGALVRCFGGGNYAEEYAIPFILIGIYVFSDYLINDEISSFRLIGCGFAFGCVLLLRPNMISVWIVFSIMVLIKCIAQKSLKQLWRFVIIFLIGMIIPIAASLAYLAANGAVYDFIKEYLLFNFKYTGVKNDPLKIIRAVFLMIPSRQYGIALIVILLKTIYDKDGKMRFFDIGYLLLIIVSVLMMAMSGRLYLHYSMVLVPLLIYPMSILWGFLFGRNGMTIKKFFFCHKKTIPIAFLTLVLLAEPWYTICRLAELNREMDKEESEVVDYILKNTDENDPIIVLGNCNIIYLKSHRSAASRYSYQKPIAAVDAEILKEFIEEIDGNPPKIAVSAGDYPEEIQKLLDRNDYSLMLENEDYKVFRLN